MAAMSHRNEYVNRLCHGPDAASRTLAGLWLIGVLPEQLGTHGLNACTVLLAKDTTMVGTTVNRPRVNREGGTPSLDIRLVHQRSIALTKKLISRVRAHESIG